MTHVQSGPGTIDYDLPCFRCDYNLRSVAMLGACPRCGEAVALSEQGFREHVDNNGQVKGDLPCPKCGYNVRSLNAKGLCSECGTPVTQALRGSQLRFSDPKWVRGLSRGMLYMILSMAAGVALYAVFIGVVMKAAFSGQLTPGATPWGGPTTWVPMLVALLGILGLQMAGLIAVSRKEPRHSSVPEKFSARRLVRIVTLMLPIAVLVSVANPALQGIAPRGIRVAAGVFTLATLVVSMVGWWVLPLALVRLFANLLKRVPSPALARFARIQFWIMLTSGVAFLVTYALFIVVMMQQGPAIQAWQSQILAQGGQARPFAPGGGPRSAKQRRRARNRESQQVEVLDFSKGESSEPKSFVLSDEDADADLTAEMESADESDSAAKNVLTAERESPSASDNVAATSAAAPPPALSSPFPPAMASGPIVALMIAYGLSACVFSLAGLAYVVLMVMVWRALAKAAKDNAAFATAVA